MPLLRDWLKRLLESDASIKSYPFHLIDEMKELLAKKHIPNCGNTAVRNDEKECASWLKWIKLKCDSLWSIVF